MVKEFGAREPVEGFFRGGMNSSTREKSSPEQLRPEIPKLTAEEIEGLLRRLNLACTRRIYADVADRAEKEQWSYRDFLAFLLAEEVAHPRSDPGTWAIHPPRRTLWANGASVRWAGELAGHGRWCQNFRN